METAEITIDCLTRSLNFVSRRPDRVDLVIGLDSFWSVDIFTGRRKGMVVSSYVHANLTKNFFPAFLQAKSGIGKEEYYWTSSRRLEMVSDYDATYTMGMFEFPVEKGEGSPRASDGPCEYLLCFYGK